MPGLRTEAFLSLVAQDDMNSQTLLDEDPQRLGMTVFNNTVDVLYLLLGDNAGGGASSSTYTLAMAAQSYYEVPFGYLGIVTGIWSAAGVGNAQVTFIR